MSMTALDHPSIYHEQSLTLNIGALIFLLKEKSFPVSITTPILTTRSHHHIFENGEVYNYFVTGQII